MTKKSQAIFYIGTTLLCATIASGGIVLGRASEHGISYRLQAQPRGKWAFGSNKRSRMSGGPERVVGADGQESWYMVESSYQYFDFGPLMMTRTVRKERPRPFFAEQLGNR